jgi:hypothetical protein
MSERVSLPPGCAGFTCADGTKYTAKKGTSVVIEDRHADALKKSQHSSIGLVTQQSHRLATKAGRWCHACHRLWQAWSEVCPRCGGVTEVEEAALC